jgi:transposase
MSSRGLGDYGRGVLGWLITAAGRSVPSRGPGEWEGGRRAAEVAIEVVAPGKTARPSGDRVKTDRKDAELLARLAMAGQPTAVSVPSEFSTCRHLSRAREAVRHDLMRCRHRVAKLLLVHGRVFEGNAWIDRHRQWAAPPALRPAADRARLRRPRRCRRLLASTHARAPAPHRRPSDADPRDRVA